MQTALVEPLPLTNVQNGGKCVASKPAFCRYPGDVEGCHRSLIQAWREGSVDKHCIFEGLQANCQQCRQVLLEGLESKTSPPKRSGGSVSTLPCRLDDLHEACKQVVLPGFPLEIRAIDEVFYEAYYRRVRSIICRYGIIGLAPFAVPDQKCAELLSEKDVLAFQVCDFGNS